MFKIGDIIQNDRETCMVIGLATDPVATNIVSLKRGLVCFEQYISLKRLNNVLQLLGYIKIGEAPITFTTTKE